MNSTNHNDPFFLSKVLGNTPDYIEITSLGFTLHFLTHRVDFSSTHVISRVIPPLELSEILDIVLTGEAYEINYEGEKSYVNTYMVKMSTDYLTFSLVSDEPFTELPDNEYYYSSI